jgi:hypothetical protein
MLINQRIKATLFGINKVYEYYRYLLPFVKQNRFKDNLNSNTNIAIFSEPRGGSTWMAELMCKIKDSIFISEPLYLIPPYPEIAKVKFCFHQYIPENAEWIEAEEFFRKLYNREIGSFKSLRLYYNNYSLRGISKAKYFIYKCCTSNMLLPWVTAKFNINPIYVIRHPCAVVSSQLKYGHWNYVLKDPKKYFPNLECRYHEIYLVYKDIIDKIKKPEERLAAEWALHGSIPIKHPENDKRWITVSYESLYKNPEFEITRIFNRLNLEIPESIFSDIRKPSLSTIKESVLNIKTGNQLANWKNQLSKQQVQNILNITREFKMDMYDESLEPEYSKIYFN